MNTPRTLRSFFIRGLLGAALSAAPAFAISPEELASLRAKAEAGNGIAQYNLGLLYAATNDPLSDPVEAFVWFNLAADNGATGRAPVVLSSQMTSEQLNEARARLDARRSELAAKKIRPGAGVSSSPVASVPISAASLSSTSPIAAAAPTETPVAASSGERDVVSLQAELKKMGTELSDAWKENEQLKATLAKAPGVPAAMEELRRDRDQLQATLAANNQELAKLRAASANFEGERNALQQRAAAAEQAKKANELGPALAAANTKLRDAENQLSQAVAAVAELGTAKQSIASLNEQLQKTTAENQRLATLVGQSNSAAEAKAVAEKELSAARSELASLQTQLADAKNRASSSDAAQKQLEDTQIKLESALRSFDLQQKDADRLQKALANIDGERESLAKQLDALKAAPPKTDAAVAQRVAQLTAELEAARATSAGSQQLQQQLADREAKLATAESDKARALQEKDQIAKQLAGLKSAPAPADKAAEQRVAQLSTELEAARGTAAKAAQLEKQLADREAKLAAAESSLSRTAQEKEQLSKLLDVAKSAPVAPSGEVSRLTAELGDVRGRLTAAEQALGKAKEERARATREATDSAQKQIAQLSAELQEVRAKVTASEEGLTKAAQERDSLRQQLTAAATSQPAAPAPSNDELASLQTRLKSAEEALSTVNNERTSLAERLAVAEARASSTPAATPPATPGEDSAELHKQLAETQSKLDAALRTYQLQQDNVDRLEKALANIDGERANLAQRIQSTDAQLNQVRSQASVNQDASAQLSAIREQLRQAQNQIASLAGENAQLRNRVALSGPPPSSLLGAPTRPGTTTAQVVTSRSAPTAPAATPAVRTHTVADGDTLTKISRRYYGTSERWQQILEANRNVIRDVNNLTLGTTLKIP